MSASGAVWAAVVAFAAAFGATVWKLIPWAVRSALEDVVDRRLGPLADDLREHMRREELAEARTAAVLERIAEQWRVNEVEHAELRARLDRVEDR